MDFRAEYEKWCTDPYFDEATKAELKAIAGEDKEIEDRFYRTLEFGTAGLRGVIGAGTNRMNIYTVRQATQGLANYILSQGEDAVKRGVAIAHDSRNMHDEFTDATALCLAANGIKTYVFPQLAPVPELSYAVRTLGTIAGVVITASHNPPEYNGYKVYWEDGAQFTPPHDKGVTEEDLMNAVGAAFTAGWSSVKLYFMIGLPGETDEDVLAIAKLAKAVQYKYQEVTGRRGAKVTVSASSFVPKPYTPFQWVQQDDIAELRRKQFLLKDALKVKNITFQYHDSVTSVLEAVFARGDRRLGKALYLAWQRGAKFDGWSEHFSYDRWLEALQDAGLNKEFYIGRERGANELFPWEHIQPAVARSFLRREYEKALAEELTHDCRHGVCTGCGVCQKLGVKIIDWKEQGLV